MDKTHAKLITTSRQKEKYRKIKNKVRNCWLGYFYN